MPTTGYDFQFLLYRTECCNSVLLHMVSRNWLITTETAAATKQTLTSHNLSKITMAICMQSNKGFLSDSTTFSIWRWAIANCKNCFTYLYWHQLYFTMWHAKCCMSRDHQSAHDHDADKIVLQMLFWMYLNKFMHHLLPVLCLHFV